MSHLETNKSFKFSSKRKRKVWNVRHKHTRTKNEKFSTSTVSTGIYLIILIIWFHTLGRIRTIWSDSAKKVRIRSDQDPRYWSKKVRIRSDQDPRYWSNIYKIGWWNKKKKPWLRRLFQTVETESNLMMSATVSETIIAILNLKKILKFCILNNSNIILHKYILGGCWNYVKWAEMINHVFRNRCRNCLLRLYRLHNSS